MPSAIPYPRIAAPEVARVRQYFASDHLADPAASVHAQLMEHRLGERIAPGARVAITAGSRGVGGVIEVIRGVARAVRDAGGEPFIIPAMGSHGGALAEGQVAILERLGITEASVGAPIHATMETVAVGTAENGAAAHCDRLAAEADGIIVVGQVKTHPESAGELASGLLKMITIGLGKQHGAVEAHGHGLWESVREVPRVVLAHAKILFGVAIVENAYRQAHTVEVIDAGYDAFLEADRRLLTLAKAHLATLPFRRLDLLVVDELGKDFSGAGLDPNVIGHWRLGAGAHIPDFHRLVVLALSAGSLGNGIGIGMADFTTERFLRAFDPAVTYVNVLTATEHESNPREASLPLALPCDRDAIEVALFSALAGSAPRLCRISNTSSIDELWVSAALLDEVRENPRLAIVEELAPMAFDDSGNLFS